MWALKNLRVLIYFKIAREKHMIVNDIHAKISIAAVVFITKIHLPTLQQLHLRLVEILTGEFMCEYSWLSTRTASVQEFFVSQLTPFLAIVRNFVKERSKT